MKVFEYESHHAGTNTNRVESILITPTNLIEFIMDKWNREGKYTGHTYKVIRSYDMKIPKDVVENFKWYTTGQGLEYANVTDYIRT